MTPAATMTSPGNAATGGYPIKTVVVLVQENRSFDHILGWMKSLNPAIDGVDGTESNPISVADPDSARVPFGDHSEYVDPDPGHSFQAIFEQLYGIPFAPGTPSTPATPPTMNGFAQEAEREAKGMSGTVMSGFRPEAVPVYRELVGEFAVCDRWFASVPASTQPNRLYVHSGTSHGATSNDTKKLVEGFPQKTIFESLDEAGFSFGIYYQYPPSTLFYSAQVRGYIELIIYELAPTLHRNLRKLKYWGKFHQFDLDFKRHCREGKLPNYVVVEQRYFDLKILPGNDDHPSHDVSEGQKLVKEVYEALRSSPQWNEILFVITYDEHGGFYDHVPSPATGVPSPDDVVGPEPFNFKFDRLGVRVPAILVSPWIEKGTVIHEPSGPYPTSQYEHSSIPATVKKIFNLEKFLTRRDAWAGTFETVLTRKTPRTDCPLTLPEPKKLRKTGAAREDANLTEFQEVLVQMGAVLNGDHRKEGLYPQKLVEDMTVGEAAKYLQEAFGTFCEACENCRKAGMDESEIVVVNGAAGDGSSPEAKKKSFLQKMFSCLVCNQSGQTIE
ncbi:hypothetical protein Taro_016628 [Colocasia esculenta]|uniref:Uncharacterized protein n=1 Tax=Colocasia esculenta TaxID=4460 RepID=A0A843UL63_COLES|nr:hypothetical protein [Colocasia esculenta]